MPRHANRAGTNFLGSSIELIPTKLQKSMDRRVCCLALLFHPSFYRCIYSENLDPPKQNLGEVALSQWQEPVPSMILLTKQNLLAFGILVWLQLFKKGQRKDSEQNIRILHHLIMKRIMVSERVKHTKHTRPGQILQHSRYPEFDIEMLRNQ